MTAKSLYFANDTSSYHAGSLAVCEVLRTEVERAGWIVETEGVRNVIEKDAIDRCDAVLVNGEGTLHRNKPRARHLMQLLGFAQELGKPTVLCNASWSMMTDEHDEVLKNLSFLSVREPLSAQELRRRHNVDPEVFPDLSYDHPYQATSNERDIRFLSTDFYSAEFDCFVWPRGGRLAEVPKLDMMAVDLPQLVDTVARTRVLITGRFHGLMVACKTRTRFVAYGGNTHKLHGVVEGYGRGLEVLTKYSSILEAARNSQRLQGAYDDLFAILANQPRWRFPLA
jgi:hypothetical protein